MKKIFCIIFLVSVIVGCTVNEEKTVKTFSDWKHLFSVVTEKYEGIGSSSSTLVCIPDYESYCPLYKDCKEVPLFGFTLIMDVGLDGETIPDDEKMIVSCGFPLNYYCDEEGTYQVIRGDVYDLYLNINTGDFLKIYDDAPFISDSTFIQVSDYVQDQVWYRSGACYSTDAML